MVIDTSPPMLTRRRNRAFIDIDFTVPAGPLVIAGANVGTVDIRTFPIVSARSVGTRAHMNIAVLPRPRGSALTNIAPYNIKTSTKHPARIVQAFVDVFLALTPDPRLGTVAFTGVYNTVTSVDAGFTIPVT